MMEYNTCSCCGANGGRAGNLWSNAEIGYKNLCENCKDTLVTRSPVLHLNLHRTEEEINKTMGLLTETPNG